MSERLEVQASITNQTVEAKAEVQRNLKVRPEGLRVEGLRFRV